MSSNKGFTLIELVTVIIILAILGAFTIPRLRDLSSKASDSHFKYVMGSFKSAVNLANMKWAVEGRPATIVVNGITIQMTATGYPNNTTNSNHIPLTAAQHANRPSIRLWYALLVQAPRITAQTPQSGWLGSAYTGTPADNLDFSYYKGSTYWRFRYNRQTGQVIQTH